MAYKVKLKMFEGPFDLLVYLIENAQMSIYDIRVAEITDQYLWYLEDMKRLDVGVASEFMVLAATLIDIKTRMILPRLSPESTGGLAEDPRTELVEKILEYKRFKAAAEALTGQEEISRCIFEKPQEDISEFTENPEELLRVDMGQLAKAFSLFLAKKVKVAEVRRRYERLERQRQTIETKILHIRELLQRRSGKSIPFAELVEEKNRYDVVLTFSTILEMAKNKSVRVRQRVPFGQISVAAAEKGKGEIG